MAIQTRRVESPFLNANRREQAFVIHRGNDDSVTLSARLMMGAVGATVLTVERSFDGGVTWVAMSPALTLSADGAGREIDFDAPVIRVRVSTAAGAACRLRITAHLTKDT